MPRRKSPRIHGFPAGYESAWVSLSTGGIRLVGGVCFSAGIEVSMNEFQTAGDISDALRRFGGWDSIYIPEFTWGDKRIDALIVDIRTRWARGFEIKVARADFKKDDKWTLYTQFCSSLSIACPEGLIQPEEVEKPMGLVWIGGTKKFPEIHWKKKPQRFQTRRGLAWFWTYLRIIERELPRLEFENQKLRGEIQSLVSTRRTL